MPTVQEVLKQTGMTDEQISALDPKVLTGFTQIVSTADQTLEAAELAKRAQSQQYETEIAPALDNWANEKASMATKIAAYETALKSAAEGGFKVPEILKTADPVRNADGTFVAGKNTVPGSPEFIKSVRDDLGGAFAFLADTTWKYRKLYGKEMPDSPTEIIREAAAQRMNPAEFAAKKYDFAGKESALRADEQKKHDDAIRAETKAASDKEWAERVGNNPMIRQAEVSRFSTLDKAVKSGTRPDPLTMTREQRHVATQQVIQKEIAENATVQ